MGGGERGRRRGRRSSRFLGCSSEREWLRALGYARSGENQQKQDLEPCSVLWVRVQGRRCSAEDLVWGQDKAST